MSRTVKYKRSGKYAGVCHSRIGFWAGPGQFIGMSFAWRDRQLIGLKMAMLINI